MKPAPRWLWAVVIALILAPAWIPAMAHFVACQQLAPIERMFVRGC